MSILFRNRLETGVGLPESVLRGCHVFLLQTSYGGVLLSFTVPLIRLFDFPSPFPSYIVRFIFGLCLPLFDSLLPLGNIERVISFYSILVLKFFCFSSFGSGTLFFLLDVWIFLFRSS